MNIAIMNSTKMNRMILAQIIKDHLKQNLNMKINKEVLKEEFNSLKTNQTKNFNFMEVMKVNKKDQTLLKRTLFKLRRKKKDQIILINNKISH